MQLIAFIHGIGNFTPTALDKVYTLEHMQKEADRVYGEGNSRVFYASYEAYLDCLVASKVSTLVGSSASTLYAGTPILGRILADYGDDIFEYYFSEKVRKDICKIVLGQIAAEVRATPEITGLTLIGHSLGSLVLLRCMSMIQSMADGRGPVTVVPRLIDEILYDTSLARDIQVIGKPMIQPVLFGSPAFSRVPSFKLTTRQMALAEGKVEYALTGQVELGHPIFINCYSDMFFHDPLSGPVENNLAAINIRGGWTHSNVEPEFTALMNYFAEQAAAMPKAV